MVQSKPILMVNNTTPLLLMDRGFSCTQCSAVQAAIRGSGAAWTPTFGQHSIKITNY